MTTITATIGIESIHLKEEKKKNNIKSNGQKTQKEKQK